MKATIRKWGNSAAVRLQVDDAVEVREESGRIVIEPVLRKEYSLAELVKGITAKNQHEEEWKHRGRRVCTENAEKCGPRLERRSGD